MTLCTSGVAQHQNSPSAYVCMGTCMDDGVRIWTTVYGYTHLHPRACSAIRLSPAKRRSSICMMLETYSANTYLSALQVRLRVSARVNTVRVTVNGLGDRVGMFTLSFTPQATGVQFIPTFYSV
jgi:hypothetical protein